MVTTTNSFFNTGCVLLLGGAVVALSLALCHVPGLAVAVAVGSVFVARQQWPATSVRLRGRLLFFHDKLVLVEGTRQTAFLLGPATHIVIHYRGYAAERLGPKAYASGHDNTIQFAGGPAYRFTVANEATQNTLRGELKNWYLHRVNLKEYRRGNRTLLLYAALAYEQSRQLAHELGVALYH